MKTIPVLLGFDQERCIGTLVVDETKLPAGAGYVFALGYLHGGPDAPVELHCVSLQSDEQYLRYLALKRARAVLLALGPNPPRSS